MLRFRRLTVLVVAQFILSIGVFAANPWIVYKDGSWTHATSFDNAISTLGTAEGTIFLPAGTFVPGSAIELRKGQAIEGSGPVTIIKPPSGVDSSGDVIKAIGDSCTVKNVLLTRTETSISSTTGSGINLNGKQMLIDGVTFLNHKYGIYDSSSSTLPPTFIGECHFIGAKNAFIDLSSSQVTGLVIWKSLFQYSDGDGIKLIGLHPSNNKIIDCHIQFCEGDGLTLWGADFMLRGTTIDSCEGNGLVLALGANRIRVLQSVFSTNGISITPPSSWTSAWIIDYDDGDRVADRHGVYLNGATTDVDISHSLVTYNSTNGIYVRGTSGFLGGASKHLKLVSNTIHSNSIDAAGNAGIRIDIADADKPAEDIQIIGNRAFNDSTLGVLQDYGLRVTGANNSINRMIVSLNDWYDANDTDGSSIAAGVVAAGTLIDANNIE